MGKVKREVQKYEKKMEEDHDHKDHKDKPNKRQPNVWAKFTGERYQQMKAKDATVQFRDVLKDPATK